MPEREVRKDMHPPPATGPVDSDSFDQFSPVMSVRQAIPPREAERPSLPLQRVNRTQPIGLSLASKQLLQHTLHIRTDPDGAVVSINGRYAGATPVTLHLEPDAYRVTIEQDGYLTVTDHLTLDPHRTSNVDHTLIEEGND
jgi:hypothetical protein